jgi:hypothetical protein
MHLSHRYIASLFLPAALAAPVAIMAAPVPQEANGQVRYYDRHHKDYHNWDDNENRAWGQYLPQNHRNSRQFSRASKREQSKYWNYHHIRRGNTKIAKMRLVRNATDGTPEWCHFVSSAKTMDERYSCSPRGSDK